MSERINHSELALTRLATQFKESENLINYILSLISEAESLEDVFQQLMNERWIETAVGFQLDILGIIVGQPRILIDGDIFTYWGYQGAPNADSFGTLKDISKGAEFRGEDTLTSGNRVLNDDEYRLFIKAKIIKNQTRSTPEDIIAQIKYLFGTEQVLYLDGNLEYTISISRRLTVNEKAILQNTDIVAKTAGVRINYLANYDYDSFFAFKGIPNSAGFGSEYSPEVGGKFGSFI